MLGANTAIDLAANAVIKAHDAVLGDDSMQVARSTDSYLRAINVLRKSIDVSDNALAAVGLLAVYEYVHKDRPRAYFSHAGGMTTILLSRPRRDLATPMTRAILYANTHGTFQEPCALGIASPFDDPYWLDMEPASFTHVLTDEVRKLRKLGNQLLIRLPGLIARVRALRQNEVSLVSSIAKAHVIACELLQLKDEHAESTLLHRVSVRATTDKFDKAIVPYSFTFNSHYEKETALLYWGTRMMIVKLCIILERLRVESSLNEILTSLFDMNALTFEQERMIMSTAMCWQDGFGQANTLSIVWSALMGKETCRGKPAKDIRYWVWRCYNDLLGAWPVKLNMTDMDETSDLYAGGPLRCFGVDVTAEASRMDVT